MPPSTTDSAAIPDTSAPQAAFAAVPEAFDGLAGGHALDALLDWLGEAVCVTDGQYRYLAANAAMAAIYGLRDPAEMLGRTAFDLYPDFRQSVFFEACAAVVREQAPQSRIGYSGVARGWVTIRVAPLGRDRYALVVHRITHRTDATMTLQQHDRLTALPNRWRLEDDIGRQTDPNAGGGVLALLDVRRFRSLLHAFGAGEGDRVLVEIAARIQNNLRLPQQAYRYGDDRFAIWAPDGQESLRASLASVRNALAAPFVLDGVPVHIQFCIGRANHALTSTVQKTIIQAECALAAAKAGPQHDVEFHPGLSGPGPDPVLTTHLRAAIDDGHLDVHFQPIVDVLDGRTVYAEALVRWNHPQHGLLLPGAFLPLAEDAGWMMAIDRYVLDRAVAFAAQAAREGNPFGVAVNLSVDSVDDPGTVDAVQVVLRTHGLPPSKLLLEVTESSLIRQPERSRDVVAALRGLGVSTAIDDFGSGQAGFTYVASYPSQVVKIDRSLVAPLPDSHTHRVMVNNIIRMIHGLGSLVVAEGVETPWQRDALQAMQCDMLQGWLVAKPMAPGAFMNWLRAHGGTGDIASPVR
ncbi:MAG: GGDEF domain-containing protein [Xanthomonadaceae bacterium]|nr:GGDEF domain-containing protein [Xanthomonadaceae bacterium]